jgi:hypothetical protein
VRFEYHLTDKGNDLYPVTLGLLAWGDRWMPDDEGPTLTVIHDACGAPSRASIRCSTCGEALDPSATRHVVTGRSGQSHA